MGSGLLLLLTLGCAYVVIVAGCTVWAYWDAASRGQPGWQAALLVIGLGWPIGVIVWLVLRAELEKRGEEDGKSDSLWHLHTWDQAAGGHVPVAGGSGARAKVEALARRRIRDDSRTRVFVLGPGGSKYEFLPPELGAVDVAPGEWRLQHSDSAGGPVLTLPLPLGSRVEADRKARQLLEDNPQGRAFVLGPRGARYQVLA